MSPADLLPHCVHDGFSVTDLVVSPDGIILVITPTHPDHELPGLRPSWPQPWITLITGESFTGM